MLTPASLANVLENYAQIVERKDPRTGRKTRDQIWPRYHQLDAVRRLLADAKEHGAGRRYLVQHSAGSGKSNSIAWLAHQLVGLRREGADTFDTVIVVTDRVLLDKQIRDTVRAFAQVSSTVGHATRSGDLRRFLEQGKKIVISTIQKFPHILAEIGDAPRGKRFAILIDEAHSSQGGQASAAVAQSLSVPPETPEPDPDAADDDAEDRINRLMASRKMLPNASYFAFTATPKPKTLETFGTPEPQPDGKTRFRAFHTYSMKQAIEEGFILDVLAHYVTVQSYYRLTRTIEDDPEYDAKKAGKKLKRFVEGHDHAVALKAEIMVDHFHRCVLGAGKIGGKARAMVVTGSIDRAVRTHEAVNAALKKRGSPHRAIVAFSGEHEHDGQKVTESSLNGFASKEIPERVREDPFRFLVVADKFQTGYDEPLLHTMYVDKALSGIRAVQTLSRLNRAHPAKHDCFVLDFANQTDGIVESFSRFYRSTALADASDPNKLHDLAAELDQAGVYAMDEAERLADDWIAGVDRDLLEPVLNRCVSVYLDELDEDGRVAFKGNAKAFVRTYRVLAAILPFDDAAWERRAIFLGLLVKKLPAPKEEDFAQGVLDAIDIASYRAEKQAARALALADEDAEVEQVAAGAGGGRPAPEMEPLSAIVAAFNDRFGDIDWEDKDRVRELVTETIPARVAEDPAYRHAQENGDPQNARVEHDKALTRVMNAVMRDDTQLFKQFSDNPAFQRWLADASFRSSYAGDAA